MKTETVKAELINPEEYGLEKKEATGIAKAFQAKIDERNGYAELYDGVIKKEYSPETVKEARELRLKLVKTRTGIAKIHKTQKAYFLAAGKFVDAWKNKETEPITQMETTLEEIEKRAELEEKARLEALQKERVALLDQYVEDAAERDLSSMDEDVWESFLATKKKSHEDKIAAEAKAEEARLAEEKRLEEVAKLNTSRQKELAPYWSFMSGEEKDAEYGEANEKEFKDFLKDLKSKKDESEKKAKEEATKKKKNDEVEKKRLAKEAKEAKAEANKLVAENKARLATENKNKERQQQIIDLGLSWDGKAFTFEDMSVTPDQLTTYMDNKWEQTVEEYRKKIRLYNEAEANKGEATIFEEFITDLQELKTKYEFEDAQYKDKYNTACGLIDKIVTHVK